MSTVHMIVGSLVVLGYIIVLALNIRTATGKPMLSFQRPLSMGAATLYLLQVLLGLSLLAEGEEIPAAHFLIALLAIFSIGAEHMLTGREVDSRRAGRIAAITNVITLAIVLTAYMIGELNS
ncbi:MAG TPA: hypothetical protein VD789_10635 [Thermomicrobiales bacterium]|nr:hypothetical protein [Thermomicrobiales bacterium]